MNGRELIEIRDFSFLGQNSRGVFDGVEGVFVVGLGVFVAL